MRNDIQKLTINGFKGFTDEIAISFSNLTVLAGGNSVGKSTIIQALLLSRIAIQKGVNSKVPLNEKYLLALGTTAQITRTAYVSFTYVVDEGDIVLVFSVPIDKNYIKVTDITKGLEKTFLNSDNFYYLNAERIGPRPFYQDAVLDNPITGFQGEYTIQLLVEGLIFDTNPKKNYHKNLKIDVESSDNLSEQTNLWMQYIIPQIDVSANRITQINRSIASINRHTPPNVGFGISYVLPIIVSGLIANEGSALVVENPEAHLHPYGQSRIGQFLAMVATSGVKVIIETHSEHVINGIRVATMNGLISNKEVLINFLSKDEHTEKIEIDAIEIDEYGDLSDFPRGFFDQAEQDLLELIKMRRQKNENS